MNDEDKKTDADLLDIDLVEDDEEEGESWERLSFVDIVEDRMPEGRTPSKRTPDDVAPLLSRWLLAFSTGDYREAIDAASEAVFKLPEDHSVRCKLATSFLMAGMVPEAVNALSYILDRDPGNEEARSLADSREILAHLVKEAKGALRSRDYDAALVSIDKAILFVPEYHESYFLRAIVRYQKGKREECMRDLEKTLELEPRHEQAKNLLEELGKKQSSGMFG